VTAKPASIARLTFIDWLRGVAVLCMILWHALDAWTLPSDRENPVWGAIVLFGGMAAPFFLFLAGVSMALAGSARLQAPNADRREVGWRLQKRGWQIFGLAYLFRLQSFLLMPGASWSSLLKPDILNVLGLGLIAASFSWSRASSRLRQAVLLFAPAATIILLTPYSRLWAWPALLRPHLPRLEAYIRPVPGIGVFSVFPWAALVFAGALLGCVIAELRGSGSVLQKRLLAIGMAVTLAGGVGAFLPPLTPTQFWTTSISFLLIRTGVMVLGMPAAWWWLRRRPDRFSPMLTLGRASLFVYWVHVEMVYGVLSTPWHKALPLRWSLLAFLGLTAGMVSAARSWSRRPQPLIQEHLKVTAAPGFHSPERTRFA
jgi:uncharacterized membrane protein